MVKISSVGIILIMTLPGCVTTQDYWTKPEGFNQAQFSGDELECLALAKRMGAFMADSTSYEWKSCMKSKGWVIQRSETVLRPLL